MNKDNGKMETAIGLGFIDALVKARANEEQTGIIRRFITGLEEGLKIERGHYENSRRCMEHLRTIHDGVLEMNEIAGRVLDAWELTKYDGDFAPDTFKGGREGMHNAMFMPLESFRFAFPKIAKIFEYNEKSLLEPYVRNIRDLEDAISLFRKDLEIDSLIGELGEAEPSRRKPILRKMFRAYKEYIGAATVIMHTRFKSPNVPEEQTDMVYQFVKKQVETAKSMVEGLRRII